MGGLTQEEFILSQFQRLQVLSQDIGRAGSFCGRGKNLSQAFLLASVSGSPCVCSSAGRHITLSAASVITWHAVSVPSHAVCPLGASLCLLSSPYKDTTHNGLRGHPPPAWPLNNRLYLQQLYFQIGSHSGVPGRTCILRGNSDTIHPLQL